MSIVECHSNKCGSCGLQARAYVAKGVPPLTKYLSYGEHGGKAATRRKAEWHEARLKARARAMRGQL
ncbi:MAG: hypothetical protein Q8R98_12100 [Rubrivivax sp.]|nr:hypothetical protein [Rubrivivax sp.]MDP3612588.1 hypothetical protein [Rubrivivax sp.]